MGKDKALLAKNMEVTTVQDILSEERKVLKSLREECAGMKSNLERKDEEVESLKRINESLQVYCKACSLVHVPVSVLYMFHIPNRKRGVSWQFRLKQRIN